MSEQRPVVSAELMATLVESAPDRVRRRLDRSPTVALEWEWQSGSDGWKVAAGNETVHLPGEQVSAIDQVQCTCLLSPNCFHVLACLSVLEVSAGQAEPGGGAVPEADAPAEPPSTTADQPIEPTDKQRQAAEQLAASVTKLLQVGVAHAGIMVQSGMLRAIHRARAASLHRAAAVAMRIASGVSQYRARAPEADPLQLGDDIADLLETTRHIQTEPTVASYWIGTARRQQFAIGARRLHGLLAEPLVTRSGFAGAVVYFLGDDDHLYTASAVRPGEPQLARDAYRGGIELGSLIEPGLQLARSFYLGSELTASREGRLGQGKAIKVVRQGETSWQHEAIERRFARPYLDQCNKVFELAQLPLDARPAGWDFVFLTGEVQGAAGPELFMQTSDDQPIRLAIENEEEAFCYRHNLKLLSHAPGLTLRVVGRLNLSEPGQIAALAIAPEVTSTADDSHPQLVLPDALGGRVNLGFDKLQLKHLRGGQPAAVVLGGQVSTEPIDDDPLAAFHRRLLGRLLAGSSSQRQSGTGTIAMETERLHRHGFATGAAILEALTGAASATRGASSDTFLAAATYLRSCRREMARARAGC